MSTICRALSFLAFGLVFLAQGMATAGPWHRTSTAHFVVEGNVPAEDLRAVAVRLEQFHAVVGTAARGPLVTVVPTVVTVFADAASMAPYLPATGESKVRLDGYLATTPTRNHLALLAGSGDGGYRRVYREYARLLLDNLFAAPPPWWVSSGLAEFYSSFSIRPDGKSAELGGPVDPFPTLLGVRVDPIAGLLAADDESVRAMAPAARELALAESWGLVHYMLLENSTRRSQLPLFMEKLAAGQPRETAFAAAFGDGPAVVEEELRQYVKAGGLFRTRTVALPAGTTLAVAPVQDLSEAETDVVLGRLLLDVGRPRDAESHLRAALKLDPRSADAHTALGLLCIRDGRTDEGMASLGQGAALAPGDPQALMALGYGATSAVERGMPPGQLPAMLETARGALSRALELDKDRPATLVLLAFALASGAGDLDQADALLRRASELAPARDDYRLMLVELLMKRQQFEQARAMATRLSVVGSTSARRERAASLVAEIARREASAARRAAGDDGATRAGAAVAGLENARQGRSKRQVVLDLRRPEAGESQTRGRLVRIDCGQGRVVFHVESAGRTWAFTAAAFEQVEMLSYRDDGSPQVGCGAAPVVYPVILTWRKAGPGEPALPAGIDGVAVALEVLPDEGAQADSL